LINEIAIIMIYFAIVYCLFLVTVPRPMC